MKSKRGMTAAIAALSLVWGTAYAGSESEQAPAAALESPEIVVLEVPPMAPGETVSDEQLMLGMLLLQMLSARQAEGDNVEVQLVQPLHGDRI